MSRSREPVEQQHPSFQNGAGRIVELIKAAIWPVVVLIAIAVFYSPLHRTLESVARQSENIQTIKLGSFLEFSISTRNLPAASADVAKVLKEVADPAVIFKLPEDLTLPFTCYAENEQVDPRFQRDQKLQELGLIKLERQQDGESRDCPRRYRLTITSLGQRTADFLSRFISVLYFS